MADHVPNGLCYVELEGRPVVGAGPQIFPSGVVVIFPYEPGRGWGAGLLPPRSGFNFAPD